MDEQAGDLAKAGLEVFAGELSHTYQDMHDRLAGRLALNSIHLEDLRAQEALRRNNYKLVTEFVTGLPGARTQRYYPNHGHEDTFAVDNAHHARQVQGHVLWVKEPYGGSDRRYGKDVPYYIVGKRTAADDEPNYGRPDDRPRLELLLCKAKPSGADDLQLAVVLTDQFAILFDAARRAAQTEFTPQEVQRMFDPDTSMLHPERLPRTLKTQLADRNYLYKHSRRKTKPERILEDGMQARTPWMKSGKTLEYTDLMSFGVLEHLNDLALAFDKVDELKGLYGKYLNDAPETGTDRILKEDDREADALMEATRQE